MNPKPRFVIWGYGSENIFRNFGLTLISQGYEVLCLPDKSLDRMAELLELLRFPYILLTSAHFGRDARILHDFYPDIRIGNEFLDLLHHCPPILSVFYPHDLATPSVINEPLLLSSFDLVLWPTPFFGYQPRPHKLMEVGWVGFSDPFLPPEDRQYDSVLLFSDICRHTQQFGIAGTYAKLLPILETGTAIKFPEWPGHIALEEYFTDRGAHVIAASTSAGKLIQNSRLIVSNSVSSISVEAAYMGTPVINLLEDYLAPGFQKRFLSGLPGCVLSSYADFPKYFTHPPKAAQPCVKQFDAAHVLDIILAEAAMQSRHTPHSTHVEILVRPSPSSLPASSPTLTSSQELPPSERASSPGYAEEPSVQPEAVRNPIAPEDEIQLATALRLLALDRVEEAFAILQTLVHSGTPLAAPYRQIAQLAIRQGETDIAEEFLTLACEREQPPGEAHLELAQLFFDTERFNNTLNILSPLLRYGPARNPEAYSLLRRTLGILPELDTIAWARLLTDLKWQAR
ncbi:MAG: hypothetical protein RBR77_11975 [Thauera sp.]|jgi:hypothetical protein|nr:hypothetical protein [Thauera sp.]